MAPYLSSTPRGTDVSSSDYPSPKPFDGNGTGQDIAIIGFSFQFPEADSSDSLWELMAAGRCVASKFPPDRLSTTRYHALDDSRPGTIRPQKACFVKRDISTFDAKMFGMTADEASGTDPQQRILLETTYRALENAGTPMHKINGSDTSVHTGCFTADYTLASAKDLENAPRYAGTGMAASMLSNRISTFFDLTGPSMTIDTACSSSLVALDMACEGLRQGKSSMGIVAGCNLLLGPDFFITLSSLGFVSPDGVSHAFDNRANGYGRGEGFGVLVVKPLEAALRDGDTIRAVIRATCTNQNGRTSLAQPSKEMQARLIQETYRNAQLDMSLTRFFEAHGTGTAIGDPLEAMAIGNTFGPKRAPDDPVIVGALKANIGHLEGAAGIAGIIKTILVLERGIIPPIADLQNLNDNIDAEFLKLKFPTISTPWPRDGLRRASINSFGFGGTNAHVVLDDALHYLKARGLVGNHCTNATPSEHITTLPKHLLELDPKTHVIPVARPRLFVWSAHEKSSATKMLEMYRRHLEQLDAAKLDSSLDRYLKALAYTLDQKRGHHSWRVFAVADSIPQLVKRLLATRSPSQPRSSPRIGFVFTGQGAQWAGMGKELFVFPVFRDSVLAADKFLQRIGCVWKASDVLLDGDKSLARINEPRFAQTLCTILQIALVELLRTFHIYPVTVLGHSSGEIAAAYAVGGISRQSAWKVAYLRGLLCSELAESSDGAPRGAMMAVGLSESSVQPYINEALRGSPEEGVLVAACMNSPKNTTLSGDKKLIEELRATLERDGIFARVLKVPLAYHSPHMLRIASSYKEAIGTLKYGKSQPVFANMVSSVTGGIISGSELVRGEYWAHNMVSPVRFSDALRRICHDSAKKARKKLDLSHRNFASVSDLVEIGSHSALQGPIRETIEAVSPSVKNGLSYTPTLVRGKAATDTLLEATGKLHSLGFDVDLANVNSPFSACDSAVMTLPGLPEYPFDHTHTYWHESRTSKNTRLNFQPYNEFLGLPVPDWNPLEPRWRNTIKLSSIPWLEDHKVNGDILFPAAGIMVMAMEAMIQISTGQNITGFEYRDMAILTALTISPDGEGVETQFHLKPSFDSSSKTASWATFSLYSCHHENFVEVCRGSIKTISASQGQSGFNRQDNIHIRDLISSAESSYTSETKSAELYARLEMNGYQYGPAFQGIESARRNNCGQAVGQVSTRRFSPDGAPSTVIHPGTLDSILQVCIPAVVWGDDNKTATWVPTYIKKGWLSSSGFEMSGQNSHVYVHSSTRKRGTRLAEADLHVTGQSGSSLLGQAEGIEVTLVTDDLQVEAETSRSQVRRLCWDVVHKPDPTLLDAEQLSQYALESLKPEAGPTEFICTLNLHILASISRAANRVAESDIPPEHMHLQKQYVWIRKLIDAANRQPASGIPSSWHEYVEDDQYQGLCDRVKEIGGRLGDIYVHFGSHLVDMLRGEVDALQVLVPDGRLKDYYELSSNLGQFFGPMQRYVDALAHKKPGMKILEVGAGTGATTRTILHTLVTQTPNGVYTRFSQYDFTDITGTFLESAEDEFGGLPKMRFRLFDVEEDPTEQGYEERSYDLIVAANVLHATKSIRQTLSNIRKLLRDDGKLILMEITATTSYPITQFLFGFLPGWWLSTETWRQGGPCLTVAKWIEELKASGFTGADFELNDFEVEDNHITSLLISSVAPPSNNGMEKVAAVKDKTMLVVTGWNEPSQQSPLAELAISKLGEIGTADIRLSSFREVADLGALEDKLVLVVQDRTWLSLAHLDPEQYTVFNATLAQAKNILWISEASPHSAGAQVSPIGPVTGVARALRSEKHSIIFATAVLDISSSPAILASNVERLLRNFLQGVSSRIYERELIQVGDRLCIPRIYEDVELNQMVHDFTSVSVKRQQRFGEQNVRLRVRRPGLLDTIYFEEVPEIAGPLAPNEIEVEVKAIGVNFRDCLIALGRVDQDTLGTECAGVVLKVGSACWLKPGDRVMVGDVDTYHGIIRCKEILAMKIPEDMSFADAGSVPTNFVTTYHAFVVVAKLSPGESVLIHSGAGGTGQAAIQVAQYCGAEIYTTVGSSSKKRLLTELYGIPPEHILNSRDLSFAEEIKRLTNNRGVDVVLNSLAGDALVASWECIAPFGRFIEIGKKDIFSHSTLPMFQFARNVSFSAVDLASMAQERPDLIQSGLRGVLDLFEAKHLRMPSPMKSFPISDVEGAFRYLQSGMNAGKVLLQIDPDDIVPAIVKPKSDWAFSSEETFLLAGGLGAQGRVISEWMVSKGARNLVLLSRRDVNSNTELASFVHRLQSSGATVYCPKCDIADVESLTAVLDYCRANMPPIRGCIQAAMELRDAVFENMDHDAWSACLRPKVHGSWNLHQQLPRDLDFFILFSSIAGVVGSQGQSNYAGGNTFQDELAKYRLNRGEKVISLNLSMIADHGYALEHGEAARRFAKSRFVLEITQPEVLALLERYCDKRLELDPAHSQVATGLELPEDINNRGMDIMGWMQEPIFTILHQMGSSESANDGGGSTRSKGPDLIKQLEKAASLAEAADIVANGIATKLCRVLSLAQESFDIAQPLHVYGVDSLIAVEMRNWFMQTLKVDVAVFEILGGATAGTLGRAVAEKARAMT
ncbi:MAG: polyketide synthase [Claussenomyces sp. TS43310]|nr:MAG: polyketide synthase [Claussenomyces sp. TS43310]